MKPLFLRDVWRFTILCLGLFLVLPAVNDLRGQTRKSGGDEEAPAFSEIRGVKLGMTADEVRKKLGDPRDKGEEQDFFVLGENEMAQVLYDKSHKVVTISVDYQNPSTGVPTPKQIFGADIEAKSDGSMYKMVRYPKAGYWLSYNKTAGSSPMITITLQKLEP